MRSVKDFSAMFGCQLLAYLLITVNYRAVARGSYALTAASDLLFAGFNFGLIKRIAKSESVAAWIGYTLGGVVGSLLGILITKGLTWSF